MLCEPITKADGIPRLWLRRDMLDIHGLFVRAKRSSLVRVRCPRNDSHCTLPAYALIALAAAFIDTTNDLHRTVHTPSDRYHCFGRDVMYRRTRAGVTEIKAAGDRHVLVLTDLELQLLLSAGTTDVVRQAFDMEGLPLFLGSHSVPAPAATRTPTRT